MSPPGPPTGGDRAPRPLLTYVVSQYMVILRPLIFGTPMTKLMEISDLVDSSIQLDAFFDLSETTSNYPRQNDNVCFKRISQISNHEDVMCRAAALRIRRGKMI